MRVWLLLAAVGVLLVPAPAKAFREAESFVDSPTAGGGGRRYFTGSRSDGLTCAVCHTGESEVVPVLEGLPDAVEGYLPGQVYDFEVLLPQAADTAAVAFEVTDVRGRGAGVLELFPDALLTNDDRCAQTGPETPAFAAHLLEAPQTRRVATTDACGAERLRVRWTAPAAGAGAVWVHLAGVEGDGSADPSGDATFVRSQLVPAFGDPTLTAFVGGCAVAEGPSRPFALLFGVGVLLRWTRRRRR